MTLTPAERQQLRRVRQQRDVTKIGRDVTEILSIVFQLKEEMESLRHERDSTAPQNVDLYSKKEDSKKESKSSPQNGVRLPDTWQPTENEREFTLAWGLDPDVTANLFRNHWLAKPGRDATKKDWHRTYLNWVMNDKRAKKPLANGHAVSEPDTVQLAQIEARKERLRESVRRRKAAEQNL